MDENELSKLMAQLNEWNMRFLYQTCVDALVDTEALEYITPAQCDTLLAAFPLGIRIKFIGKLMKTWSTDKDSQINVSTCTNNNRDGHLKLAVQGTTAVNIDKPVLSLCEVLESSYQGCLVLDHFKKWFLNDASRTILVDIVIKTAIKEKINMTVKVDEEMADQIIAAFPSEVKDYYFMRDGPKAPKGKLYAKYHNVIRSLKSGGLIEKTKNTVKPMNSGSQTKHFEDETNIDHLLNSLKHDNCTFNEIEVIWAATVNNRLNSIRKSQNSLSTELVEDLNEGNVLTENSRDCYVFYLLHALLVPTSKKTTRDDKGRKSLIKYSIRDSQQSFIIFAESSAQAEDIIARKKDQPQPLISLVLAELDM
ncbi:hypothetical protein ACI65C_005008 [Semiaphis heraclei]